jgi:NitT/TauT family transport system substrate-binding protein
MKRPYLLIAVLVVAGGAAWLYSRRQQQPPTSAAPEKVVLSQAAKTLLYLPLYVAIDQEFASKHGVDISIVTAGGDSPAFAALASGQAQFAQGDPTFVAVSHEKGGPGMVIASVLDRVAFWAVTFDKKIEPFTDPRLFKNRTVVTFPEPNTSYVVQKALVERAGLKLGSNTRITQATFGTELGPIKNGQADMAMSIEPNVSQAEAQGARVVFSYPDAWGPFLLTGLMTTEEFARSKPAVVQGVVDAYEEALQAIRAHPDQAVATGVKYFPEVSPEVIRTAVKRLSDSKVFPDHARVDPQSWTAALDLRVKVGDLKSINHGSEVDNSFADRAAASPGK